MTTSRGDETWKTDTLAELTSIGTTSGVAVGQLAVVSEAVIEGVYECTVAGATTSTWVVLISGGAGTPGGSDTQVQFNDGGAFGGDSLLTWDKTANRLSVGIGTAIGPLHVFEDTAVTAAAAGVTVEQDGTGDAALHFVLTGLQDWTIAVDNSDSDKLKISPEGFVGGTLTAMTVLPTGEVGFGTQTPAADVDISNTAGSAVLQLTGSGANARHAVNLEYDINYTRTAGAAIMDFRSIPGDGIGASNYRFGVSVTTTGSSSVSFIEPNAGGTQSRISSSGLVTFFNAVGGRVSIGDGIGAASAKLAVVSTTQGFIPPRMTTVDKNLIGTPATGLQVDDITLNSLQRFDGSVWTNADTNIANTDLTLDASRVVQLNGNPLVILDGTDVLLSLASPGQSILEFGDSRFQADADGLALDFGVADHFELSGAPGTAGQVFTSNGVNLPPTWESAGGPAQVTFAALLAIGSPSAGDTRFVTDAQVQATFTYNATFGKWTAPEYNIINNNDGVALVPGDVVQVDNAVDFSVSTTTVQGNPEIIGVVVVGGADSTDILIKYAGEVLVNKIAGSITRDEFIFSSTTPAEADWAGTGGIGDFGMALEDTAGSQVRMLFKVSETFG